ncbi:MAG: PorV/PorQ family protein [Melioribacteraceae bacterium]|nr:PorV/PorQ family protein [Melioribacteraceae bacterium]
MKKNSLIIIFLVLGLFTQFQAQDKSGTSKVGTTVAQFLKIGAGARAVGMGGAYSAMSHDIYSVYWNPAGLSTSTNTSEVTFNHASWLADIKYDFAAASFNMGDMGTLAASFTSLGVPEQEVTTLSNPDGDGRMWDASSIAIGLTYSKMLTDRFSIGVNAKFIRESIWNSSASGFAIDVGTLYRTPFNDLTISAAIFNFGSDMSLDGRDIQLNIDPNDNIDTGPNNIPANYDTDAFAIPMMFRFGLAMDVVKSRYMRLTTSVDAVQPNDNSNYLNLGSEFAYDEMFMVRLGYRQLFMNNSEGGLTFGAGLKYKIADSFSVFINYAYADYGENLKEVHFFDVSLEL